MNEAVAGARAQRPTQARDDSDGDDEKAAVATRRYGLIGHPDPLGELNLERMVTTGVEIIAMDGESPVGPATAKTIQIGNILHKTAVLAGVSTAMCAPMPYSAANKAMLGFSAASVASAAMYGVFVQTDPLCKYQVDARGESASELPTGVLRPGQAYVVLVRRDDTARRVVHYSVAVLSVALCVRYAPAQMSAAGTLIAESPVGVATSALLSLW